MKALDVNGDHKMRLLGCEYPIYDRRIPKRLLIRHILSVTYDVFKHYLAHIELSLHAYLEEYGGKALYHNRSMVVGNQLHMTILCKIKYLEVR